MSIYQESSLSTYSQPWIVLQGQNNLPGAVGNENAQEGDKRFCARGVLEMRKVWPDI